MSSESYRTSWEDEIDLRTLLEVILRRKNLIIGLIIVAMGAAALLSFFVLPSVYESQVVVQLRPDGGSDTDLSLDALSALALSPVVLDDVRASLPGGASTEQLRRVYEVKLDANARLLYVSGQAGTAAEAYQLVDRWEEAFSASVIRHGSSLITARATTAGLALQRRQADFDGARERLRSFESEQMLDIMSSRLSLLERDLTDSEARLRTLTQLSIPEDEERLAFLQAQLAEQTRTWQLGDGTLPVALPDGAGGLVLSGTILNPVYLQLSEDIAQVSQRLAANKALATALSSFVLEVPLEITALRREVAQLRNERERLIRDVAVEESLLEQAEEEYHTWLRRTGEAEALRPVVVSEPTFPTSPVAPRKLLNIALAAFLAAFVGVGIAFLMEIWHSGNRRVERHA